MEEDGKLRELFLCYQGPLHTYACARLRILGMGNRQAGEIAQDVVSEVFIRAIDKWSCLDTGEKFFGWLLATTRLCAMEAGRRVKNDLQKKSLSELLRRDYATPETSKDLRLERAVDQLDRISKEIILLKYYAKPGQNQNGTLSCKEIARLLGMPVGTVTSRLARAYSQLHLLLTGKRKGHQQGRKKSETANVQRTITKVRTDDHRPRSERETEG
jgi:RNA polymerase sigma factor (sigma-70 family)